MIHFQMGVAVKNILQYMAVQPMTSKLDGHALCCIETGQKKATLIDFNYTHEPYSGKYPVPVVVSFDLLGETTINRWGKLAFRNINYLMMQGIEVPRQVNSSWLENTPSKRYSSPNAGWLAITISTGGVRND